MTIFKSSDGIKTSASCIIQKMIWQGYSKTTFIAEFEKYYALYQFILTTDEKPTVVYPIWDRIYYGRHHIPGSHLG